jgi:signal transduction histidine kinase
LTPDGDATMDDDALRLESAKLNEQLKLLVRTEKRLYQTQNKLEDQLRQIRGINEFALAVKRLSSPIDIVASALDLLVPLFSLQGAVAVVHKKAAAEPIGLARSSESATTQVEVSQAVRAMTIACVPKQSSFMAPGTENAPLIAWLDQVTETVEGDLRRFPGYRRSDLLMPLGTDGSGATAFIAFRSARVTHAERQVTADDVPFLDIICQHVTSSVEMAQLYATLEQRVAERTADLQVSNQQLADSIDRLQSTQKQLVEASRRAGMSDVATSVLHNVGNVLNSVNVSAALVEQNLAKRRAGSIGKVAALLAEHQHDLASLFTSDNRGKRLPQYLQQLAAVIEIEDKQMAGELASLRGKIDHIKAVIVMQQDFARMPMGVMETVTLDELIDDALKLERTSYEHHEIALEKQLAVLPSAVTDRHKILQILTNLLRNARHAVSDRAPSERRVAIRTMSRGESFVIEIEDSGCGIAPEHLNRIFNLGFTTKAEGHGFGLHSSACAAGELGGRLTCSSPGRGLGARFWLELPFRRKASP